MTCPCRLISCDKYTFVVQDIDSEWRRLAFWGTGVFGNSLCLLLNFAVNLKTVPENKVCFLKSRPERNCLPIPFCPPLKNVLLF